MKLLVVDDEPEVRSVVARMLERLGHEVVTAPDGPSALRCLDEGGFAAIVSDHRMPGMSGAEVLREAARRHPRTARFMLTAFASEDLAINLLNDAKIHGFFTKPLRMSELERPLEQLARARWERTVSWQRLASEFGG